MVLAIACALASAALYQSPSPEVAGGGPAVDGFSTEGGKATLPPAATAELRLLASTGSEIYGNKKTRFFKLSTETWELSVSFFTNGIARELSHFLEPNEDT